MLQRAHSTRIAHNGVHNNSAYSNKKMRHYVWQQLSGRAYECELCHRCGEKDISMNIFSHMIHAEIYGRMVR